MKTLGTAVESSNIRSIVLDGDDTDLLGNENCVYKMITRAYLRKVRCSEEALKFSGRWRQRTG